MDTLTPPRLASELGVSSPRVHRAIHRLGLDPQCSSGGHTRLSANEATAIERMLGRAKPLNGMSRDETLVLAALSRRPFGVASVRATARAAGVAPTTAAKAVRFLEAAGYVERVQRRVTEGRVSDIEVIEVRWDSPEWRAAAPLLAAVILPESSPVAMPRWLPARFAHLFWDVPHPTRIDLEESGVMVAHRILTSADPAALSWAATVFSPSILRRAASIRGTDPRTRSMARNLAR